MFKRSLRAAACLALVLVSSPFATAGFVRPLAEQDPSGFNTNDPDNWSRGWRFKVNANNVFVTELGLNTPIANQRFELTLWDVASQTALASVSTTSAQDWKFESIAPVELTNGNEYIISLFSNSGGSYYYQGNPPSSWKPTGTIEYLDMRYHNNANNVFPTLSLTDYQYGIPDFSYQIGPVVPEPTSMALWGLGLAGVAFARRRR